MMSSNLKIDHAFSYHEERVSDSEIRFGWKEEAVSNVEAPYILSYGSKSKKASSEEVQWSKDAGTNAASLNDYISYFSALTGSNAEDFLSKWGSDVDSLESHRTDVNPNYKVGEGKFLLSLASLIHNGKRFSQYGRVFKLIQ